MSLQGMRQVEIDDKEQGHISLLVSTPRPNCHWGALARLRETQWGDHIRVISGEAYSHALHGWATPMMREIGPHPHILCKRIDEKNGRCSQHASCVSASDDCRPCRKLPDCYEAPGLDERASHLASQVALAWKVGVYVVVIEGDTFSL